jgi:hypothetical protein
MIQRDRRAAHSTASADESACATRRCARFPGEIARGRADDSCIMTAA